MKGFVFRLIPPRRDFPYTTNDEERSTMAAHFVYLKGLAEQGKALAFGPVDETSGVYGIGIVLAEDESEAMALREADPALLSSHGFRSEMAPMLSLVGATQRLDE
jgi:uncharacterized protein